MTLVPSYTKEPHFAKWNVGTLTGHAREKLADVLSTRRVAECN